MGNNSKRYTEFVIEVSADERRFLLFEKYNGIETSEFFADLDRLAQGEPVAYLIGWVPFLECKIFLDSQPLIPRSETEYWVERACSELQSRQVTRVLDLFAGSGAIGIAVLKKVTHSTVDFGEINEHHFPTIEKNITKNNLNKDRMQIFKTDVWSGVPLTMRYDAILANPPYLSKNRTERIEKSVALFEPSQALFADHNGFALIEKTMRGLPDRMEKNGVSYIEHEPEHTKKIQTLAKELNLTSQTFPDQYGTLRFSRMVHSKH